MSKRPVKYSRMDRELFLNNIQYINVHDVVGTSVVDLEGNITGNLYMCAENSVRREGGADQRDACQAG